MFILNFITPIILFLSQPQTVFAVNTTPSASQDVQSIREVVQQKVKEKLNIITSSENKPKSIFGSIKKINNSQITISFNNQDQIVTTTEDTVFVGSKKTKISLTDLKENDEIIAMGYFNKDNQLEAKRIVVFSLKEIQNNNQIINGQVVDVSQTSSVFTVIPHNNKNSQYQIETTSTNIKKISSGQKIIAVVKPDEKVTNTFELIKTISSTSQNASVSATSTPAN